MQESAEISIGGKWGRTGESLDQGLRRENDQGASRLCLYPLYGMVLPFLEMGHTLGKLNQRLEFRGPLR